MNDALNVAVLGAGSWGTTVASLVSANANTTLWARSAEVVAEINSQGQNSKYLPNARLHRRLRASDDLEYVVRACDVLVMAIPAQSFRRMLVEVRSFLRPWVPVISLSKGLEQDTQLRMTEIIQQELPGHPVGVLSGPNLATEIMQGFAAASVIAMDDPRIVGRVQKLFHSGLFRVYTNNDVVGCELGGVLKNIIAIAAGMGDGQGAGENTRSTLITRGLAEVSRLGVALGGQAETFYGLAGMGDLIATCTSVKSRNRTVGFELGKGRSIDEIIAEMFMVAEGVKSAPSVIGLARDNGVPMPISEEVYKVVTGKATAKDAFRGLLRANVGQECQPG
tara:strand:- start:73 stop:1080 length:1008 start_codon:yes stop_codon:yes gene_type:complete